VIQRTVLLRLHPEHRPGLDELGQRMLRLLRALPMVAQADVAVWRSEIQDEDPGWDLAVTVVFVDAAALDAYGHDEVHACFVREHLVPLVAQRHAFSLELLAPSDQS